MTLVLHTYTLRLLIPYIILYSYCIELECSRKFSWVIINYFEICSWMHHENVSPLSCESYFRMIILQLKIFAIKRNCNLCIKTIFKTFITLRFKTDGNRTQNYLCQKSFMVFFILQSKFEYNICLIIFLWIFEELATLFKNIFN